MPTTYIHDGTSHRKAKKWYVNDGTAWRNVKKAYCHDGTDWRLVFRRRSKVQIGGNDVINDRPRAVRYLNGKLYVIGMYAGGTQHYIAEWDGSAWAQPFGTGAGAIKTGSGIEYYAGDFYVSRQGALYKLASGTYTRIYTEFSLIGGNCVLFNSVLVWGGNFGVYSYNGTTNTSRYTSGGAICISLTVFDGDLYFITYVSSTLRVVKMDTSWSTSTVDASGTVISFFYNNGLAVSGGALYALGTGRTILKLVSGVWNTVYTAPSNVIPEQIAGSDGELFLTCYDSTAAEYDLYKVDGTDLVATTDFVDAADVVFYADDGKLYVAGSDSLPSSGELYSYE
jgi:hypothetical protein